MMSVIAMGSAATGAVLLSRVQCHLSRFAGAGLVAAAVLVAEAPAWADQTVMASDTSKTDCTASAREPTRISLDEDAFAAISKISTGNPTDDVSVVHAPLRDDNDSEERPGG